jgi:hypothetical protein
MSVQNMAMASISSCGWELVESGVEQNGQSGPIVDDRFTQDETFDVAVAKVSAAQVGRLERCVPQVCGAQVSIAQVGVLQSTSA